MCRRCLGVDQHTECRLEGRDNPLLRCDPLRTGRAAGGDVLTPRITMPRGMQGKDLGDKPAPVGFRGDGIGFSGSNIVEVGFGDIRLGPTTSRPRERNRNSVPWPGLGSPAGEHNGISSGFLHAGNLRRSPAFDRGHPSFPQVGHVGDSGSTLAHEPA